MTNGLSALIVEGGAMRGIFAAGVLDSFLDNRFKPFDFTMGVSAGSTNLASYLAGQRGRSHAIITDYSCRKPFINSAKYLRGGHYIDLDWLWKIAYSEYRLDSFAYAHQDIPLWAVTTNVTSGQAEYHLANEQNLEHLLLASCAVPFAYRDFPSVCGVPQTDGGIADSIPVIEAYRRGARTITVILSQIQGYRKKKVSYPRFLKWITRKYPALGEAMLKRHLAYNDAIRFIESPPSDCTVHILSPSNGFEVGRTTKVIKKLNLGYEMGILAGQAFVSEFSDVDARALNDAKLKCNASEKPSHHEIQELAKR